MSLKKCQFIKQGTLPTEQLQCKQEYKDTEQDYCHWHRCRHSDCREVVHRAEGRVKGAYSYCEAHLCITVTEGVRCKGAAGNIGLCVHHQPAIDAVVPPEPKAEAKCPICMEYHSQDRGIFCKGEDPHFLCDGCFSDHVNDRCGSADAGNLMEQGMHLYCAFGKGAAPCNAVHPHVELSYTLGDIAQHASQEALQNYIRVHELAAAATAEREARRISQQQVAEVEQITEQFARGVQLADDALIEAAMQTYFARCVPPLVKEIQDVLSLKMPCCGLRFVDWDGCAALSCPNHALSHHFCGLCLQGFGHGPGANDDCHRHHTNLECRNNPEGRLFVPEGLIAETHNRLKQQLVVQLLQNKDGGQESLQLYRAALNHPSLIDCGIDPAAILLELANAAAPGAAGGAPGAAAQAPPVAPPSMNEIQELVQAAPSRRLLLSELFVRYQAYLQQGFAAQRQFIDRLRAVGFLMLWAEQGHQRPVVCVVLRNSQQLQSGGRGGNSARGGRRGGRGGR